MEPVAVAHIVGQPPNYDLRLRVLSAYRRHVPTPSVAGVSEVRTRRLARKRGHDAANQ
jgi:hypothetical protein